MLPPRQTHLLQTLCMLVGRTIPMVLGCRCGACPWSRDVRRKSSVSMPVGSSECTYLFAFRKLARCLRTASITLAAFMAEQ